MKKNIFSGLKVVELCNVLAGPATAMFFAELGAEVVKIENALTGGDLTRKWKLPSEKKNGPVSAYYLSANYGKRTLFLDLNKAADLKKVRLLISKADVLISNFKKGDDKRYTLSHKELKTFNPSLIYAHLSGYGEKSERTAFDLVLQAETGFMSMNGTEKSGPLKMPVALIDILAAHQLKEAILIALLQRERTGKGSYVSVSLYDAAIASLANQAANYLVAKKIPARMGSLHPNIAPYGETFSTKDKKMFVLAIGNDKQFNALCMLLKNPGLSSDPRYSTNSQRVKNRLKLFQTLAPLFKRYPSKALNLQFEDRGIPAGFIRDMAAVFEQKEAKRLLITSGKPRQQGKVVRTAVFDIKA